MAVKPVMLLACGWCRGRFGRRCYTAIVHHPPRRRHWVQHRLPSLDCSRHRPGLQDHPPRPRCGKRVHRFRSICSIMIPIGCHGYASFCCFVCPTQCILLLLLINLGISFPIHSFSVSISFRTFTFLHVLVWHFPSDHFCRPSLL